MRYFAQAFLFAFILLAAYAATNPAFAAGPGLLTRPFGGYVITTNAPLVACIGGTGPVTIAPVGGAPAGPYYFPYGLNGIPTPGKWVLGNYSLIMSSACKTTTPPPVVVPTFKATLYGLSRGF
jgi:hypothetical protein